MITDFVETSYINKLIDILNQAISIVANKDLDNYIQDKDFCIGRRNNKIAFINDYIKNNCDGWIIQKVKYSRTLSETLLIKNNIGVYFKNSNNSKCRLNEKEKSFGCSKYFVCFIDFNMCIDLSNFKEI